MKRRHGLALIVAGALLYSGVTLASNGTEKLNQAIQDYASQGQFSGVTLNIACRHLPAMDFLQAHAKLFEKYTGATIKFINYPENSERAKVVTDASTKAGGFQMYCLDNNYVPMFADNGWVYPLNDDIKPAYQLNDIFKSLRTSYSWDGKIYGLPIYSEVTILYYRKDLFKKAGIKHPPTTMAELAADAKKLNNPPRTFGIALRGLRGGGMNVYIWTEWLRSYGGNFLNEKMEPVFNSAAGIKATKKYKSLLHEYGPPGVGSWGWPKVESSFAAGRIGMIIESTAFYPIFVDPKQSSVAGKVGYAVVPAGPKGRFPANYSIGLAVASTVPKESKAYDAAMSFIQWGTSKQMEMARLNKSIGNSDRTSVLGSPLFAKKVGSDFADAVKNSKKYTNPNYRPRIPHWREMGDIIGQYLESTFTNQMSVKEALDKAAAETKKQFTKQGITGTQRPYKELFEASSSSE